MSTISAEGAPRHSKSRMSARCWLAINIIPKNQKCGQNRTEWRQRFVYARFIDGLVPSRRQTVVSQLTCRFPHPIRADGSVESICIACYATVASGQNETGLAPHEKSPVSDAVSIYYASQVGPVPVNHLLEESVVLRQFLPFPQRTSRHTPAGTRPEWRTIEASQEYS
jgi:hypothetical protein